MTGWRTYSNTNDFTVIYNEDTVELRVHINGNISIPSNPNWTGIGGVIPSNLAPKNIIVSPCHPQTLAMLRVYPDGVAAVSSTYSNSFSSQIHCILRWKY